jgi:pyruvate/2-oxoglutarate dehydrogenase complex dihydrolipoamide dehydrogenase (E3) component
VLLEARNRLGGGLALWADLPGREHYRAAVDWWTAELERRGVDVRLDRKASAEDVLALQPDAVIVATGARYSPGGRSITIDADIPGYDLPFVYRPEEILIGGVRPMGRVFVFDAEGYHTGTGIAELLARGGAEVQFVTATYSPVSARNTDNWEERYIVQRLKTNHVRLRPTTWIRRIEPGQVILYDIHTDQETYEPADAVILSTAREPIDGIARALEGRVPQLFTIGDALGARMLAAATYEGQKFARLIGEPGSPANTAEAWFQPDNPATMLLPADVVRKLG